MMVVRQNILSTIMLKNVKISYGNVSSFQSLLTTQMMVVRQDILSTIMQKNVKRSYGNVRFHLATPEIC